MRARKVRIVPPLLTVSLFLAADSRPVLAQATSWKEVPKPALKAFEIPKPRRAALSNGMVLYLMEDHELPLINAFATVKAGSRYEPADRAGMGEIISEAWRTGGTRSRSGDELDDFLEARAAKVETWMGATSAGVSLSCLKGDFDDVLKVFAEVLREPAFAEEKIQLAKNQVNTEIARRNDNPIQIAERESLKLAYGPESAYARVPEYATAARVGREDLVAWHKRYVHPGRIILAIVGDFDSRAMEAKLRKTFAAWPKGPTVSDPEPAYRKTPKPGYYFIEKEDVNQTNIRLVHLGTTKDSPDFYALEVMNEVFGGGFSARLFSNVRSKKGLAYNVRGSVGTEYDYPGVFRVAMGTKSGTTGAGIDALFEEVVNIVEKPATPQELQLAKDSILNSFIFRFDSREKILRQQALYEYYGYPLDFLDRYRAGIEKVTAEDVARAARKYVRKGELAVLVVGKSADFDRPLSSFGPVTTVDVSIPAPGAEKKTEATADSRAEGKALFEKVLEGLGGKSKIAGVKDLRMKGKATATTPQGEMAMEMSVAMVFPDRIYQKVQAPFGTMTMVSSPGASFLAGPRGTGDLPASMKEEIRKELHRSPLCLGQKVNDPKLLLSTAGSERVGAVDVKVLDVSYEGSEVRWFIDPSSGRILRASYPSVGPTGPGTTVTEFSDWKTVEGITLPFKHESTRNGERTQTLAIEELQVNSGVDPKLFEKPAAQPGS